MNTLRKEFGMTAVGNTIVVCGGWSASDNASMSSCEQFLEGRWTALPAMPTSLAALAMITLHSRAYIFGGWNGRLTDMAWPYSHALNELHITNTVYMFEFKTQKWTNRTPMFVSICSHEAVPIGGGQLSN
jgi:hypothetical protein